MAATDSLMRMMRIQRIASLPALILIRIIRVIRQLSSSWPWRLEANIPGTRRYPDPPLVRMITTPFAPRPPYMLVSAGSFNTSI